MNKYLRISIYVLGLILIVFFSFLIFFTIKASYGGLNLNFLENRISKVMESNFAFKTEIDDILLKRDRDRGFYFEITNLEAVGYNNLVLDADLIYWDFRLLNFLSLSFDKNNKVLFQNSIISHLDSQIFIEDLEIDFDELEYVRLSVNEINVKNNSSDINFSLLNNRFKFKTNSIFKILNSEITFKSSLSFNNEIYTAEAKYVPSINQINILKFNGNDFYMNENSLVQFDTKQKTARIKFDINSKKDPIIESLRLNSNSEVFPIINGFKGWQSLIVESNFKYNRYKFLDEIFANLNLKISGVYELGVLMPDSKVYENFGNITNYSIDLYNERDKYVVNINKIKNDQISLKKGSFFKVNKEFNDANINLVTSIDKNAAINFLQTTILSREKNTGRVVKFLEKNLNENNDVILNFNINPTKSDIINSLRNLYVISSGELNTEFIFDDNEDPNFIYGPVDYYIEIKDLETDTPSLKGQIDLTKVEAYIRQINFKKNINTTLKIQFEGDTNSLNDSLINFDSLDSEIDFDGKIKVSKTNHIYLEKLFINNKQNIKLNLTGDLSERVLNLNIKGDIIDLSKNKVETKKKERVYYLNEENYSIISDKVIFAGSVQANDFRAVIEKKGPSLSVNSQAISNNHELNYSREKNESLDVNIINSTDITYFVNEDHPARKLLSDGEFKMTSIRNLETQKANVDIDLNDFVLINSPASLKLLSLPSISGLVSIAEGEQGIRFGYGEIKYLESENEFSNIEAFAVSDSLGLILEGQIDRKEKIIDMKGEISPMHLVNAIIQKLPILGPIIVGNEGEGMFSIDFTMSGSSEFPEVTSNPLTIIKPRIIERAIEALNNNTTIQ